MLNVLKSSSKIYVFLGQLLLREGEIGELKLFIIGGFLSFVTGFSR